MGLDVSPSLDLEPAPRPYYSFKQLRTILHVFWWIQYDYISITNVLRVGNQGRCFIIPPETIRVLKSNKNILNHGVPPEIWEGHLRDTTSHTLPSQLLPSVLLPYCPTGNFDRLSKTTDAKLDCAFVENALVLVVPEFGGSWAWIYSRLVFCALWKKLKAKITQCFNLRPKTQGFFLKKLKVMRPNPKPDGIKF